MPSHCNNEYISVFVHMTTGAIIMNYLHKFCFQLNISFTNYYHTAHHDLSTLICRHIHQRFDCGDSCFYYHISLAQLCPGTIRSCSKNRLCVLLTDWQTDTLNAMNEGYYIFLFSFAPLLFSGSNSYSDPLTDWLIATLCFFLTHMSAHTRTHILHAYMFVNTSIHLHTL